MEVKVYSRPNCNWCVRLKEWLDESFIPYDEIIVDNADSLQQFMTDCPGLKSVPQILVDGKLVDGGYQGFIVSEAKEELLEFYQIGG